MGVSRRRSSAPAGTSIRAAFVRCSPDSGSIFPTTTARRDIAGQNTRQAQGRRKRLERMLRDEAVSPPRVNKTFRVVFQRLTRSGSLVLETRGLQIGHPGGQGPLIEVPDIVLERGARIALIGPNGAGKTTFIKTLLGEVEPLQGEFRLGEGLRVGYLAQADEGFDPKNTVLEELQRSSAGLGRGGARAWLGGEPVRAGGGG